MEERKKGHTDLGQQCTNTLFQTEPSAGDWDWGATSWAESLRGAGIGAASPVASLTQYLYDVVTPLCLSFSPPFSISEINSNQSTAPQKCNAIPPTSALNPNEQKYYNDLGSARAHATERPDMLEKWYLPKSAHWAVNRGRWSFRSSYPEASR